MYHHGLVKILVEFHLKSIGDTWEDFLVRNFSQDAPKSPEESHVKKSRGRKININIQNKSGTSSQKNDAKTTSKLEGRKQTKQKGKMKERAEEINEDILEPSSPQEDEKLPSKRLTKIREKIKKKEIEKRNKDTRE